MKAPIPAAVNPALLVWARQESGFPVEPVAKRLHVTPDRLVAWELGQVKPTVRQVRELAGFYRRPFGIFFLPAPPVIPPLAAQYRKLPGVEPGEESPEFRLAVRIMLQRRETALNLAEELGAPFNEFRLSLRLGEPPIEAGRRLREALGVTMEEQSGWRHEWEAWWRWRGALENAGVLVLQFPKVPLVQARGVSLLQFPLPVVGINSKESSAAARAFTLMHELVHIALALGKEVLNALKEGRDAAAWMDVERYAEEVASHILIPKARLDGALAALPAHKGGWDIARMKALAAGFRVTPLAMATRLRSAGVLTWEAYRQWKALWDDYLRGLPARKGFATPIDKTIGRCGRPLAQLVLQAMDTNRITAVEASRTLDLRFNHFEGLRERLYKPPASSRAGADDGE